MSLFLSDRQVIRQNLLLEMAGPKQPERPIRRQAQALPDSKSKLITFLKRNKDNPLTSKNQFIPLNLTAPRKLSSRKEEVSPVLFEELPLKVRGSTASLSRQSRKRVQSSHRWNQQIRAQQREQTFNFQFLKKGQRVSEKIIAECKRVLKSERIGLEDILKYLESKSKREIQEFYLLQKGASSFKIRKTPTPKPKQQKEKPAVRTDRGQLQFCQWHNDPDIIND